jgi:hypothetical protein
MKKVGYFLLALVALSVVILGGISLGNTLYEAIGSPIANEAKTAQVCGILVMEDYYGQQKSLHTCIVNDPDNPDNFRMFHPGVPSYANNTITFYAGVSEVPVVESRGEAQAY